MKKTFRLIGLVLMAVMSFGMLACGSDDDGSSNSGSVVDGVNVASGKKLVELKLATINSNYNSEVSFKIKYDSKGRMTQILQEEQEWDNQSEKYYSTGKYNELATIDYDFRIISIPYYFGGPVSSYSFSLNENGYVSQIGRCHLSYDSNGYLKEVSDPWNASNLVYEGNDLLKASVSPFSGGNVTLYYVTYGNTDKQGNLYINVKRTDSNNKYSWTEMGYPQLLSILAYQAGMLGKVTKSCLHLKDSKEASAIFDYENSAHSADSYNIKLTFKYE